MSLLDLFTKKWAKRMASQMIDAYIANKKYYMASKENISDLPAFSNKEILQTTLLGAPEKKVAKVVLENENLWEENSFTIDQVILMYVTELWKSYFKMDVVPENKRTAIEDGVSEAIKNME